MRFGLYLLVQIYTFCDRYDILQRFYSGGSAQGRWVFSKENLVKETGTLESSLRVTLARQVQSRKLIYLGQYLSLIVPPEYQQGGEPSS